MKKELDMFWKPIVRGSVEAEIERYRQLDKASVELGIPLRFNHLVAQMEADALRLEIERQVSNWLPASPYPATMEFHDRVTEKILQVAEKAGVDSVDLDEYSELIAGICDNLSRQVFQYECVYCRAKFTSILKEVCPQCGVNAEHTEADWALIIEE